MAAAFSRRCASRRSRRSSGLSAGASPREDEEVALDPVERVARSGQCVPGSARLGLDGDLDPVERARTSGRGDDDERVGADRPGGLDDPVHHPPAEQRVEVLRRRRAHARAKAGGEHDSCGILAGSFREDLLGRQDSNLGSRDQNPLPYHLATPQESSVCHASAAVGEQEHERDDGEERDDDQRERPDEEHEHRHERDETPGRPPRSRRPRRSRVGAEPVSRPRSRGRRPRSRR